MINPEARPSKLKKGFVVVQASILMLGLITMSMPTAAFATEPATPAIPVVPTTPNNPNDPTGPVGPTDPSLPCTPGTPATPTVPATPATPSTPGHPGEPGHPEIPGHPGTQGTCGVNAPTAPTTSCIFVSDATTQQDYHNSVPVSPINAAWASISGATWIWGETLSDADAQTDKTETFTKYFNVTGNETATLEIASDNGYTVRVNGIVVADATANPPVDNFSSTQFVSPAALAAAIVPGANVLEIDVINSGVAGATAIQNPAGLDYKLTVNAPNCSVGTVPTGPGPTPAHITLIKHVVNTGGGTAQASDFNLHVMTAAENPVQVAGGPGSEVGTPYEVAPNVAYNVTEDATSTYATTYGANCENVTLNPGDDVSCTVTNTYVPPPTCDIVSDSSTQVADSDSAVLTFIHSAWTHLLDASGAKWIWNTDGVTDPTTDTTEVFTKVVHVTGTPTSATIDLAADNGYDVTVNGTEVGGNHLSDEFNYGATTTIDILGALHTNADNTIVFTVKNFAMAGGTLATNPAGLDYDIHINNGTCTVPDPHNKATVVATKVICDSAADLPKAAGASHTTDATTATAWVAQSGGKCHLASDWQFQWGNDQAGDGGPATIGPVAGYTSSAPTGVDGSVTMSIPLANIGSAIHMREVLQDGFIPFTNDNSNTDSAEFSCASDGLNYDNWDFINNPSAGATYYCAAFNAPAAPKTSTVTMCKTSDADGNPKLSGWNLFLKGDKVGNDISVDSSNQSGTNSDPLAVGVSYLALASGTWTNQNGVNPVDAEYSTTDNWATHMDGYTGFTTDILETEINGHDGNWGPYNSGHSYAQSFTQPSAGPANFGIFDGVGGIQNSSWFADNSGTVAIGLYKGYAGVTDNTGCVTFNNVPYGTYTVGETAQDGWTNVSDDDGVTAAGATVTVDSDTESYTLENHYTADMCPNIQGTQETVPAGDVISDGQCVPSDGGGNTHTGSITIVKNTTGGDASFNFTLAHDETEEASQNVVVNTTAGTGTQTLSSVEADGASGEYNLTENPTDGWNLDSVSCVSTNTNEDEDGPAFESITNGEFFVVDNGDHVTCTFHNTKDTNSSENFVIRAADLGNDTSDLSKWFFVDDQASGFDIDNTKGTFVNGPDTAPVGAGSAQISATTTQGIMLDTLQFAGTRLDHITSLAYSTYLTSGPAISLALQFDINPNMNVATSSYDGRLVYEPYYTHTITPNTWQTWNPQDNATSAGHGSWWFSKGWIATQSGCTQANPCTWAQVLAAYPNIGITGSTDFKAGSNWASDFTGSLDKFVIGIQTGSNIDTKTFDFEPTPDVPHTHHVQTQTGGGSGGDAPKGEVEGASTSTPDVGPTCSPLLTDFLKFGWGNNADQVKKLQQFLSDHLGINLPVTGFFGPATLNAVKLFQKSEWENVLKPWIAIPGSGITGADTPTGFVYLTTKWEINNIVCPGSEAFPSELK